MNNSKIDQMFGAGASLVFKTPDPIILQRTELGIVADCPHQGKLCVKYKDKIETHDILPEAGKVMHTIAKTAIETCEYNLQEAADYIVDALPKALGRTDLQPEVLKAGKNLANEIRRFGGNRVLLCDEPITRSLIPATQDRGEVLIVSEPDLALATTKEDTIIVLDYKGGFKDRTNAEARDDFQTCVNCFNLFGKFPDVNLIHFWYLNTRIFTRSYARIERDRDGDNFQARIFEAARLFLEGSDEAWPEPKKCSMCDVVKWCKLCNGELVELKRNPEKYLDSSIALNARLAEMNKTMTESCTNGRVIYGSCGYFDGSPKKKAAVSYSYKPTKNGVVFKI